jgi:hypothetical protein
MKTKWIFPTLITIALLAACAPTTPAEETLLAVNSTAVPVAAATDAAVANPEPVNTADLSGLTYVREEEKLAHDVYQFLYEQWGVQVFTNIASSEQTHTDTVKSLLDVYALPDPAADLEPGQFTDASLRALYEQLTAQGSLSLADAFKVGGAIEEIDILDLQARLAGDLPADVRLAYENLLAGSYNHLSAFTSTLLRQTGETYVPQYMTQEAYEAALDQATTGGNGNGYRGGGQP